MCACKGNNSSKQVTTVKQVVKKPIVTRTTPTSKRGVTTKRVVFKRHM